MVLVLVGFSIIKHSSAADLAPSFESIYTFGSSNDESVVNLLADGSTKVLATNYTGTLDVSGSSDQVSSAGAQDYVISKYSDDNVFSWAKSIGGTGTETVTSLATDSNDAVYIGGSFEGTVDFNGGGGGTGPGIVATSNGFTGNTGWSANPKLYSFDVTNSQNTVVVLSVTWQDTSIDGRVNNATFGGQAMTEICRSSVFANTTHTFYVSNPTTGSNQVSFDVVKTFNAGSQEFFNNPIVTITEISGTDTSSDLVRDFGCAQGFSQVASTTLDTQAGDFVFTSSNLYNSPSGAIFSPLTGFTESFQLENSLNRMSSGYGVADGSSTTPGFDISAGNRNWTLSAVAFTTLGDSSDSQTSSGNTDGFIQQLNSSGSHQWSIPINGSESIIVNDLAVDSSGNIYAVGNFAGTADFDPNGTSELTSDGGTDGFLVKYNSSQALQWVRRIGGTGEDTAHQLVVTDSAAFVTGSFSATAEFDSAGSGNTKNSDGDTDAYVVAFGSDGSHTWVRQIGGAGADAGLAIDLDSDGDIVTAGTFTGNAQLDEVGDTASVAGSGATDIYQVTFGSDGSFSHGKQIGGTDADVVNNLSVLSDDSILVGGYFAGTIDFDPSSGSIIETSQGSNDGFLLKLAENGDYDWRQLFGNSGDDQVMAVASNDASIYAAGTFSDTVNFNNQGLEERSSAGGKDVFSLELTTQLIPTAQFTADSTSGNLPLTVTFTDQSTGGVTSWEWDFDNDGDVDSTEQNPVIEYDLAGTYSVSLTSINSSGQTTTTKNDYITVSAVSGSYSNANFSINDSSSWYSGADPFPIHTALRLDPDSGSEPTWGVEYYNDASSSWLSVPYHQSFGYYIPIRDLPSDSTLVDVRWNGGAGSDSYEWPGGGSNGDGSYTQFATSNQDISLHSVNSWGTSSSNQLTVEGLSNYNSGQNDRLIVALAVYSNTDSNSLESITNTSGTNRHMTKVCSNSINDVTLEAWVVENPPIDNGDYQLNFSGEVDNSDVYIYSFYNVYLNDYLHDFDCSATQFGFDEIEITNSVVNTSSLVSLVVNTPGGGELSGTNDWDFVQNGQGGNSNYSQSSAIVSNIIDFPQYNPSTTTWFAETFSDLAAIQLVLKSVEEQPTFDPNINIDDTPGATEQEKILFSGQVLDQDSVVTGVTIDYSGPESGSVNLTALDGAFDSNLEFFSYQFGSNLNPLPNGEYSFTITATTDDDQTDSVSYDVIVISDNGTAPSFVLNNLEGEEFDQDTLTFTGTASDDSLVFDVEFAILAVDLETPIQDWQSATPTDGAFDENSEDFTFDVTLGGAGLADGTYYIAINVTDGANNNSIGYAGAAIGTSNWNTYRDSAVAEVFRVNRQDSTAPNVSLQEMIPDPVGVTRPVLNGIASDNTDDKTSNITSIQYRIDGGSWIPLDQPLDGAYDSTSERFSIRPSSDLTPGEHTYEVRAIDASSNDTNSSDDNASTTFTIEIPGPAQATTFEEDITFDSQTYLDSDSSNLIWGNGMLRLAEEMDIVCTELADNADSRFGPRYGSAINADIRLSESASGDGYWYTKDDGYFAFYDTTNSQEYEYSVDTFLSNHGIQAASSKDIIEVEDNGEYHTWISTSRGLLGINWGSDIADGYDSYTIVAVSFIGMLDIDTRGDDYRVLFFWDELDAVASYRPDTFNNNTDPSVSWTLYGYNDSYTIGSGVNYLHLDETNNLLYIANYSEGVQVLADGGTPTNEGDDNFTTYTTQTQVFDIGTDQNNLPYFAGNNGLWIVTSDNSTPNDVTDDTLVQLLNPTSIGGNGLSAAVYYQYEFPVEDQFFVTDRTGHVYYVSTNGSYSESFDDQLIDLEISDRYPTQAIELLQIEDDRFIFGMRRLGLLDCDLNRSFMSSGTAETIVQAQSGNFTIADFLTLEYITTLLEAGGYSFDVSNDGGATWTDLALASPMKFPAPDYRLKFRITMTEGSTPVLGGFGFKYSGYQDDGTGSPSLTELDVLDEPAEVASGSQFSFIVDVDDQLGNPIQGNTTVAVQLKNSTTNQPVTFNITSVIAVDGTYTVNGAVANVFGNHYIELTSGSVTGTSDPINFTGSSPTDSSQNEDDDNDDDDNSDDQESNNDSSNSSSNSTSFPSTPTVSQVTSSQESTVAEETGLTETNLNLLSPINDQILDTRQPNFSWEPTSNNQTQEYHVYLAQVRPGMSISEFRLLDDSNQVITLPVAQNSFTISKELEQRSYVWMVIGLDADGQVIERSNIESFSIKLPEQPTANATSPISTQPWWLLIPLALSAALSTFIAFMTEPKHSLASRALDIFGIFIPRKKKVSGLISDAQSKRPIPFANISLVSNQNQILAQTSADQRGRYQLKSSLAGSYQLLAEAAGYQASTEKVEVKPSEPIVLNMMLNKQNASYFSKLNKIFYHERRLVLSWVRKLHGLLSLAGFGFSLYAYSIMPSTLTLVILILYLFTFVFNAFNLKHRILD